MRSILKFSDFIFESQSTEESECTYYDQKKGDGEYENYWAKYNKMSDQAKEIEKKKILDYISEKTKEVKEEYRKWYSDSGTIAKFSKQEDPVRRSLLSTYLPSIKSKIHLKPNPKAPKGQNSAWGYFLSKYDTEININLYNFWNGKQTGNKSVHDTLKHEMAHAIDSYFTKNGVRTYDATHPPATSHEEYMEIYLINDKDQFARLNILRQIIGAGPSDSAKTLLNKFMSAVDAGKITSKSFKFTKGFDSNKQIYILAMNPIASQGVKGKVSLDDAKKAYSHMMGKEAIVVGGKENYNIEQLFSNFAKVKNDGIYVNMNDIANLNLTSKGF